jgi:pimeloyl-ACP methyl ester carboxylesterase
LRGNWYAIAPDHRGYGRSEWQPQGYWRQDYLADLEVLLDRFSPDEPVTLVGHSLGGNIVMMYSGVRPQRVRRVVSLEGFGLACDPFELAPKKVANWLDQLADPPTFRPYENLDAVAERMRKSNPRLTRERARFLAEHWAIANPDGTARLRSDPRHKLPFPTLFRIEEFYAVWRQITAPVLWIGALDSQIPERIRDGDEDLGADRFDGVRRRMAHVPSARLELVSDAGHAMHHDQPEAVAALIERFLVEV